jgi:hypothetical protein
MIKTTMSRRLCRRCCCNSHDPDATAAAAAALAIPILPIPELTLLKEIPVLISVPVSPRSLGLLADSQAFRSAELLSRPPSTKKTRES